MATMGLHEEDFVVRANSKTAEFAAAAEMLEDLFVDKKANPFSRPAIKR